MFFFVILYSSHPVSYPPCKRRTFMNTFKSLLIFFEQPDSEGYLYFLSLSKFLSRCGIYRIIRQQKLEELSETANSISQSP